MNICQKLHEDVIESYKTRRLSDNTQIAIWYSCVDVIGQFIKQFQLTYSEVNSVPVLSRTTAQKNDWGKISEVLTMIRPYCREDSC